MILALVLVSILAVDAEPAYAHPSPHAPDLTEPRQPVAIPSTEWYCIEIDGVPAGYQRNHRSSAGDTLTSSSDLFLRIKRDQQVVHVHMGWTFEETKAFEPIKLTTTTRMGNVPVSTVYMFQPNGVSVTRSEGDRVTNTREPRPPADWLTPANAQARLLLAARERPEPGFKLVLNVIEPSVGLKAVQLSREYVGDEDVSVRGSLPSRHQKWKVQSSQAPGLTSIEWLDSNSIPSRSQTPFGALMLILDRCTEAAALATRQGAAPELLTSVFVRPPKLIARPRTSRQSVITVTDHGKQADDGKGQAVLQSLPSVGAQRSSRINDTSIRLDIQTGRTSLADPAEMNDARLRASSRLVSHDDPRIAELASKALATMPATAGASDIAEKLRVFVHRHITSKGLGVGFASASETARSQSGDCTEHAVLLCAMLRHKGLPARVVSGLVYMGPDDLPAAGPTGAFGYHLWTQVLLPPDEPGKPGRWLDVDATLSLMNASDATHIAIATSTLADDDLTPSFTRVLAMMGAISIRVDRIE